jgi:hypothetical protein
MNHTYQYIIQGAAALAMILAIIYLVRLRWSAESPEPGLLWKMLGFAFLGAFTFTFNGFPLPLGFIVYLLLFRRPDRTNHTVKHRAAQVGLLLFCISAIITWMPDQLTRYRTVEFPVSGTSIETLDLLEDWKMVNYHNDKLRLDRFELEYEKDGTIRGLRVELFNEKAIPNVTIQLHPEKNVYSMRMPVIYPKNKAAEESYLSALREDYRMEYIEAPLFMQQIRQLLRSELLNIAEQQQTSAEPSFRGIAAEGRLEGGLSLDKPVYRMEGDHIIRMTEAELGEIRSHRSIRMYGMVLGPMIDHGDGSHSQSGQGEGTVYLLYDVHYSPKESK